MKGTIPQVDPNPNCTTLREAIGVVSSQQKGVGAMSRSRLLTREEVADSIQISLVKLDRMRLAGDAPPEIKIGRSVRFSEAAFNSWLEQQSAGNEPKKTIAKEGRDYRPRVKSQKLGHRLGTIRRR